MEYIYSLMAEIVNWLNIFTIMPPLFAAIVSTIIAAILIWLGRRWYLKEKESAKETERDVNLSKGVACPRISVHLVKRIPLVSHTPSDSHIPASSGGVWDCKTAQYN